MIKSLVSHGVCGVGHRLLTYLMVWTIAEHPMRGFWNERST